MFSSIRQRFKDMRTISALCSTAESYANAVGQQEPGAEHFLLAALNLPDGSARRAFERIGANPQQFSAAIEQQYRDALQGIGLDAARLEDEAIAAVPSTNGIYRAQPSGQALMQRLADQRKAAHTPLLGAHVVLAAVSSTHGVAPRALRSMGIDADDLAAAAQAEIEALAYVG